MTLVRNGVPEKLGFWRYLGNIIINPFLTAVATWAVIYSVRLVTNTQALMQMVPYLNVPIIYGWAALYLVGGAMMLIGSAMLSSKLLASGCALFSTSAMMNAAFVFSSHVDGYKWQAFNMALFSVAAMIRMIHLMRGEMLVWVKSKNIGP